MFRFLHKSYSIQFNIKAQSPFFLDEQKVLWMLPLFLFQVLLFSSPDLDVKFVEWWIWPSLLIKSIITKSKVSSGIAKFIFKSLFFKAGKLHRVISKLNNSLRCLKALWVFARKGNRLHFSAMSNLGIALHAEEQYPTKLSSQQWNPPSRCNCLSH